MRVIHAVILPPLYKKSKAFSGTRCLFGLKTYNFRPIAVSTVEMGEVGLKE